jgi:SAM-dependent methyltransferase
MRAWLPRFACPDCATPIDGDAAGAMCCPDCGTRFAYRQGIYRFLTPVRQAAATPFLDQYRAVREQDGYRVGAADYYRVLPSVPAADLHAQEWRIRQQSYRELQYRVFAGGPQRSILDVGAGNGWLAHRLAALGHRVAALDLWDDDRDGLGVCRHYAAPIACVQADFDALPFAPRQFDVVIFNGSLHYAPDVAATLCRARRVLVPGGTIAVMDSPMFRDAADGHRMVSDKLARFKTEYGLGEVVHPSVGFLTATMLATAAHTLALHGRFYPSRGSWGWRMRRQLASIRRRRAAAAFGVWIAR